MKRKMTKISSIIICLVITMTMLILPAQSVMADPAPGTVDLVLIPATLTVNPGDNFEVTVQAQCGTQTTHGIDAYIDFDPLYLEVQSVTPGTTLGMLQNVHDNTLGTIDFGAGSITPVTGTFTVLTIAFTAKSVLATSDTAVSFQTSDPRTTQVILGEDIITGALTGATYTINDITPPTVQAISPINDATDVPIDITVAVTFSEAMDHSATEGAFSINPPVTGTFSWNPASTILTITPDADLALDTNYILGISTAATDTAANHLAADYSSTFATQATLPAPPAVATLEATDITNSTVTLTGDLTSLGTATSVNVSFEYGYTTAYGKTTAVQPMDSTATFSAPVTGLLPGMEWHYRAVAVGEGTVYGDDATFTTTGYATKFTFISARDGNEEVYAMTPDGDYARLTENAYKEAWPRLLPDFTKVTFTSWRDSNAEIYVMYPDGTVQTRLTNNAAFDGMSDFSWGGAKIAFVSDRDGNYEIYVMNANGTGQTRLTDNAASDIMPTFSPDGTEISFVSNRDGNYEIYVMNADGTGQTRLTDNDVSDTYPSWLLDGTQISFSSMRDGNSEIYTMDANGSNPVRLTDNDITDEQPFWCPTGNAIVFTSWVDSTPQVVFIGMRDYVGYQAQFTDNPEGNWSRANWTIPDTQIFTITASAGANGSIAPSGAVTVSSSDNQSFIITPDTGYHVANVLVDGTPVGAVTSYHFTNVTANHTISATFADDTTEPYTITASAGANGSIMPSGVVEVNPGDSQTFAIAAVIGYHVADVLVDGVSVGAVGSYDFDNVMANHTIVVSFASNDSLTEILKSIIEGTDDGYSTSSSGDFSDNVTWYEAGSPTENATHNAWFRFTDITIPANAIIDEAFLETIHSNWYTGTSLKIFAEAADNPSAPTSADDHSSRVRTATGVAWTNGYSDITWHTSPNFASVIQELVSSYSYNNGVIQILVDNDGSTAGAGAAGSTFEHTGFAPRLYIRYRVEPSVTTNAATSVTASTAIMNGNLTSLGNASSANVYFEYGTSTSYGDTVAGAPSSLTNIGAFTANLAGLTAGTTYFYRAKVVGTGTAYGAQATFTTPSTPPSGGGGGGGGSSSLTSLNLSGMSGSAPVLNAQGEVISSSVLTSTDGQAKILIPAGTKMLRNGSALSAITCAQTASPPEPPADNIIVAGYNFGPDGATFNPPITLTLHFNIADLPAGTLLSELQLAFWDGTTWQILSNSQVDAATGQISAQVSHFTHFAILSAVPPVTPAPVPTVTPTVTPTTEPAPTQPTKTLTPSEPSAVVPPAEASISETPQPITGKSPAPSINLWVILGVIAIIIIGILTIASARQIKRRRSL